MTGFLLAGLSLALHVAPGPAPATLAYHRSPTMMASRRLDCAETECVQEMGFSGGVNVKLNQPPQRAPSSTLQQEVDCDDTEVSSHRTVAPPHLAHPRCVVLPHSCLILPISIHWYTPPFHRLP